MPATVGPKRFGPGRIVAVLVALAMRLFELGWVEGTEVRRVVRVTDRGARELRSHLGLAL